MADTPVETPPVDIPMDAPDAPATQAEEPKRQRGRPPGSKNKPKVSVVPLEAEPKPERELEPEPVQPKRARKPKVVEPQPVYVKPPPLDHAVVKWWGLHVYGLWLYNLGLSNPLRLYRFGL